MRSVILTDDTPLFDHVILDFKNNLLINIYQIQNGFAFRYLSAAKEGGGAVDPISHSSKENWAWGIFSSPEQAKAMAREYYLSHGIHQLSQAVSSK